MTDDGDSDEERYANDSFENEWDSDPEISEDISTTKEKPKGLMRTPSIRFNQYYGLRETAKTNAGEDKGSESSSDDDDDDDVVFSKSLDAINTEPMKLEDVLSPQAQELKRLKDSPYIPFDAMIKKLRESEEQYLSKGSNDEASDTDNNNQETELDESIEELANQTEPNENEEDDEDDGDGTNGGKPHELVNGDSQQVEQDAEYKNWNLASYECDIIETNLMFQPAMEGEIVTENVQIQSNAKSTASKEKFRKEVKNYERCKSASQDELTTVSEAESEDENESEAEAGTETESETDSDSEETKVEQSDVVTLRNTPRSNAGQRDEEGKEEEDDDNDDDDEEEESEQDYMSQFNYRVSSRTPSGYDSDFALHLDLMKKDSNDKLKKTRKSWSFTNAQVREIERQNHILLKKILSQKPTVTANPQKTKSTNKFAALPSTTRVASAAVNRKKQQRQIDLDNQLLKRRIEAISLRRPKLK